MTESAEQWRSAPFRPLKIAKPRLEVFRKDSAIYIRNAMRCSDDMPRLFDWVTSGAARHPGRPCFSERRGRDWHVLSYGEFARQVDLLGQGLLDRGIEKGDVIASISPNSVAIAVLQMAAISVGAIFAPISPSYAQGRENYDLLRGIFAMLKPKLLYVEASAPYATALAVLDLGADRLIAGEDALRGTFSSTAGSSLAERRSRVTVDDTAKILLTSGSTGRPKGVVNTHRMIAFNQIGTSAMWSFLREKPPIQVCWLPWHHTMAGNYTFFASLANGGTFYIDDGRPTPEGIARSIENLTEIRPTLHCNVPRVLDMLLPFLEQEAIGKAFFEGLDAICFSGAALPSATWARLNAAAVRATGRRVHIITSWGTTETGPIISLSASGKSEAAVVGVPAPGVTVKLAPVGDLLEGRIGGQNVTPGYLDEPQLTQTAFDEEKYYKTGDAFRLMNENGQVPELAYAGRISENFKLTTGTWVRVGELRIKVLTATAPLFQDCVIAGDGRDELGILAFMNLTGVKQVFPEMPSDLKAAAAHTGLRDLVRQKLAAFNQQNPGSSNAIRRVVLETEPLRVEAGEIADKGYVNQRAVLTRRRASVEALFNGAAHAIEIPHGRDTGDAHGR